MLNYNITNVRPGTEKQVQANILGKADVELTFDGAVVAVFKGIDVRRSNAGKIYVKYPAQVSDKKNEKGYPIEYPYYSLFADPSMSQWKDQLTNDLSNLFNEPAPRSPAAPQRPQAPSKAPPPRGSSAPARPSIPRASAPSRTPIGRAAHDAVDHDDINYDFDL